MSSINMPFALLCILMSILAAACSPSQFRPVGHDASELQIREDRLTCTQMAPTDALHFVVQLKPSLGTGVSTF